MAGKPAGGGTPATDALTAAGVPFILHPYTHHDDSRDYGAEAARELGVDELQIFKTLVVDVGIGRSPLAVGIVRRGGAHAQEILEDIVDIALGVVEETLGLDAQLSNWALVDDHLAYFDVTTPLLADPGGAQRLDTEIFLASLPWALRTPVRRFVLPGIVERYHRPRSVVLDLAANLIKEGLEEWIDTVLVAAGNRLDPVLTEAEVRSDYRSDARTWALLQAVRRVDRTWQQRVRRRTYPFLLPERIER